MTTKIEIEVELEEEIEATYDRFGNCVEGGMYDAGGHIISENYAHHLDAYMSQLKDN